MFEKLLPTFSPKVGLSMLAKMIPERVHHPVGKYEMRFFANEKAIDFLIYMPEDFFNAIDRSSPAGQTLYGKYNNDRRCHLYKFDNGEKICSIVLKIITPKLEKEFSLHYVVIIYDENKPTVTVESYGEKQGEKLKHTFEL